jgi:Flp pilus assembly pilin Flp
MLIQLAFFVKHHLWQWEDVNEEGQGLTEYALIILLVAFAVFAVLAVFGVELRDLFQHVTNLFESYTPST